MNHTLNLSLFLLGMVLMVVGIWWLILTANLWACAVFLVGVVLMFGTSDYKAPVEA